MGLERKGGLVSVGNPDKELRLDAIRSTNRLLEDLGDLGINLTRKAVVHISKPININDLQAGVKTNRIRNTNGQEHAAFTLHMLPYPNAPIDKTPHSVLLHPFLNLELIEDHSYKFSWRYVSLLEAHMDFSGQPFRLVMPKDQDRQFPYKLSLIVSTHIPKSQEISLDMLPLNFRSVGFSYDFLRNPKHRERLSEFSERRVDMDMVSKDPLKQSGLFGRQTPNGIKTVSILHLQTPNPLRHLECYEVELFGPEGRTNLDNTQEIVPESHWQEEERHYCMTGDKETLTFPLFPIKEIGKISTLSMEIHYDDKRDDSRRVHKLLQGFPLSIDGSNQWYATGYLGDDNGDGKVELLFKPEWGDNNAALVYHQASTKRISPEQIHMAVVEMTALKKNVTESLAV